MYDLNKDLSILTNLGKFNFTRISDTSIAIISHDVEESLRDNKEMTSIDIGVGVLHIYHVGDEIKYKFIPAKKLDDAVLDTVKKRKSRLIIKIDESVGRKLKDTYKGLI